MKFSRVLSTSACVLAGALGLPAAASALPHSNATNLHSEHVCPAPSPGGVACDALVVTQNGHPFRGKPTSSSTIAGYYPADLQSAYGLAASASSGAGQTVALVDAYDDPNAASDLATYRNEFGLPALSTCTVSGGTVSSPGGPCFTKVGETGSPTSLPGKNGGWAEEESLDVDMVSAICPQCNIVLVEANKPSTADLGTAVNTAASLGATEISNSYGGNESTNDPTYDSQYYNHPGIAVTASSGDSGYGVEYPAASPDVTAVGGTSLSRASGTTRGWSETAWSGAGAGCSADDPQPAWQSAVVNLAAACANRAVADVSFDADPNTGVAVYDSYSYQGYSGWLVFGGTSVGSPSIASVYARAGNAGSVTYGSYPYSHTSALNDVTSGSDGTCSLAVLCTAGPGWDGPTGLGTPNGTGAF
ncbi:MAG TPA: S53 family peptidase [Solirubrobacteraceae bacterium]|nr:S53 family peptidase [Solirubrobacteraceae bacterium]